MSASAINVFRYDSPVGQILLGSFGDSLCLCDWYESPHRGRTDRRIQKLLGSAYEEGLSETVIDAVARLEGYFGGNKQSLFPNLLLLGTDFQKRVWNELRTIPYGQMTSYQSIAHRIGKPMAVRAVANAVGANPISIFVPCHRVVGSNGSLTGYTGGLEIKEKLLKIESCTFLPFTQTSDIAKKDIVR